jgi:hypothetical protein
MPGDRTVALAASAEGTARGKALALAVSLRNLRRECFMGAV